MTMILCIIGGIFFDIGLILDLIYQVWKSSDYHPFHIIDIIIGAITIIGLIILVISLCCAIHIPIILSILIGICVPTAVITMLIPTDEDY